MNRVAVRVLPIAAVLLAATGCAGGGGGGDAGGGGGGIFDTAPPPCGPAVIDLMLGDPEFQDSRELDSDEIDWPADFAPTDITPSCASETVMTPENEGSETQVTFRTIKATWIGLSQDEMDEILAHTREKAQADGWTEERWSDDWKGDGGRFARWSNYVGDETPWINLDVQGILKFGEYLQSEDTEDYGIEPDQSFFYVEFDDAGPVD